MLSALLISVALGAGCEGGRCDVLAILPRHEIRVEVRAEVRAEKAEGGERRRHPVARIAKAVGKGVVKVAGHQRRVARREARR